MIHSINNKKIMSRKKMLVRLFTKFTKYTPDLPLSKLTQIIADPIYLAPYRHKPKRQTRYFCLITDWPSAYMLVY
jgi:hypothetical protein